MKNVIINIILMFSFVSCIAQSKRGDVWISGYSGNKIDFSNNMITTEQGIYFPFKNFDMGSSAVSDTNGNLVLASDGFNIYDNLGNYIEDGDTLVPLDYFLNQNGHSLVSQGSIILACDNNKYYFITPTMSNSRFADCQLNINCYFDLLLYNVIDMNANGGMGKVTKRMEPLMQNANLRKTQMMACKHGNGKDWWLLKQEGDSANVHTFLFTQDSVYDKGVQVFGEPVWGRWDIRGQSTFNSDGSKYATTSHGSSTGLIFLADFDRCYGKLTNPKVIQMPWGSQHITTDTTIMERLSVGLAFSPNNKFLYVVSMSNIYQYDLTDSTWFHLVGLDTSYNQSQDYETAYLAPDSKIYIGNFGGLSKQMSRIDNPDIKGTGCNFCPRCLRLDSLGSTAYVRTPTCMPNYSLVSKVCYPLDTPDISRDDDMIIYPNPSNNIFYIGNRKGKKKELYNSVGQLIISTIKDEIDVSRLCKGLYYLICEGQAKKIIIE